MKTRRTADKRNEYFAGMLKALGSDPRLKVIRLLIQHGEGGMLRDRYSERNWLRGFNFVTSSGDAVTVRAHQLPQGRPVDLLLGEF